MSKYIITRDDNSDSLTHYGVKGMKWKHHKVHSTGLSSEYVKEYLYNRGGTKSVPSLKKNSTLSSRKMTKKEKAKAKIDNILGKSKTKLKKGKSKISNKFKKKPKGYMYVYDGSKIGKDGRPKRVKQAYY